MSLPPAPKDISAHPAKGSVIDPVDKTAKDADVQRKIKLFNALSALRQSHLPSNAQIDHWIDYAISNPPLDVSSLSKEGQKLVADVQEILRTLRSLIHEKNGDELIQEWMWSTREVDSQGFVGGVKGKGNGNIPEHDKMKADATTASQHVRTLVRLVLTNGEFRKLIADFSVVARDLAARGAVKLAEGIRPTEDRLRAVDESERQNHFVESSSPGTSQAGKQTSPTGVSANGQPESAVDKAKSEVADIKDQALGEVQDAQNQQREGVLDQDEAKGKMAGLINRVKDAIPQGNKDKANEQYSRGREFLKDEYFPKERRDQWIWRAKKVLVECQKHEDYKEAITWLLNYAEEYVARGQTAVAEHAKGASDVSETDSALTSTLTQLRIIIERFSGGKSLTLVQDPFDALADHARRDAELRQWFAEGRDWLRDVLLKAGYVLEPASTDAFNSWIDRGKAFYGEDGKYREQFNHLFDGVGEFVKGIGEDPGNKKFASDWSKLVRDLLFAEGEGGGLTFKKDLWMDIRKVVLPMLVEKIGYIPIPRVEYTDDAIDLVVENLTLSGRNLFPNVIGFEAHNYVKFSPYAKLQEGLEENKHEIKLTFGQMQADMRDVAFYYSKKTGIPKMQDSGLADVVVGGSGLTATAHLISSPSTDPTSIFSIKRIQVKVESIKFSIRDSKHDFLYKTLKPLAMGLVKKQIEKAVNDAIRTGLEYVDDLLVSARDRMEEEKKKDEGKGRMGALQDVFTAKKESVTDKASEVSRAPSHFKVVSNKRDSLLANKGHPSGWVNRVETGPGPMDSWKSNLFDFVPADTTTNHAPQA